MFDDSDIIKDMSYPRKQVDKVGDGVIKKTMLVLIGCVKIVFLIYRTSSHRQHGILQENNIGSVPVRIQLYHAKRPPSFAQSLHSIKQRVTLPRLIKNT